MKRLQYIGLLTLFIASLFLSGCEELDNLVNTHKPKKKTTNCGPIDERVNVGIQLDCENGYIPIEYTLWAAKFKNAGTVTISNDDNNLYVTYTTNETADLGEVRVNVWYDAADVPCKRPKRRKADFVQKDINANEITVEIPLIVKIPSKESNNYDVTPTFYVAAYAALVEDINNSGGSINAGEKAYGGDDPAIPGNRRGAWFYVDKYNVERCDDVIPPDVPLPDPCKTAFAFGDQCFLDLGQDKVVWTNGPIGAEVIAAGCNIIIDDMSVGGVYIGDPRPKDGYTPIPITPVPGSGSVTITGDNSLILGGQRDVTLNKKSGGEFFPSVYSETNEWGDVIFYNSLGNLNATWTLTYGELGNMDKDFTIGNSDRIRLNAYGTLDYNGTGTPLVVTIVSNGDTSSVTKVLTNNSSPIDFMFSEFTGTDFRHVNKIIFEFEQKKNKNTSAVYGIGTICVYSEAQTSPTTTTTPIYAGAEQCDATNGTLVGTLTVDYDDSTAVVTYTMDSGYTMNEVQLYVGNVNLPPSSPEDYPHKDDTLEGVSTYTFTVEGLSGDIYVAARSLVCGDFPQ